MNPEQALKTLMDGNERFTKNLKINRDLLTQVEQTQGGQQPFAAILGCMDSRAPAEVIFDQGIGDIFSIRVAGNVISTDVLGSLEFAVCAVGVKLIMVLGHTNCGAIKGACDDFKLGNLTSLLNKIKPAIAAEDTIRSERNGSNKEFVNRVCGHNVQHSIEVMLEESELLREALSRGDIKVVPAMYDLSNGAVTLLEEPALVV